MEVKNKKSIKKYRFDEYLGIFGTLTEKRILSELEEQMGIGSRMLRMYRNATFADPQDISLDKLGAAALVFSKYMEQPINVNDLVNEPESWK